ncbi:hypothetical protein CWO01_14840 [Vibrio splendidus]|uniref:glycosyltransferase n=1 Tax=Vibrio splendidus TaxID=29497 RepID=UPI000D33B5AF|nr:glycosyltransferase [Vibrio splendidus]PTP60924.1 hypothetical protein CWO01_14840 [Vibrio splendidus]
MIVFYNPYESGNSTGATRRIDFLSTGLRENNIVNKWVSKSDIDKNRWLRLVSRVPVLNRFLYFFSIYIIALQGHKVVTEVIFSPIWNENVFLTVHDLKAFDVKAKRGRGKKIFYKFFCNLSHKIISVSEYTKNELISKCNINPDKIIVIPNGVSKKRVDSLKVTKSIIKYDFIYLSSLAKHKRHVQLIRSLPTMSSLLIVGRDFGELYKINDEIDIRTDVNVTVKTDVASDDELFSLLKASKVGVFPSIYEGFGIPLLEYYAAGLAIVASNIEPFKELSMFVDYYHIADDQKSLSNILTKILGDDIEERDLNKLHGYTESNIARLLVNALGGE